MGMIWASGLRLALSQPLFKILGYWGPSTLPVGTTGLGVEDHVLVLNSLEMVKSLRLSRCGGAFQEIPTGSTPLATPCDLEVWQTTPSVEGKHSFWRSRDLGLNSDSATYVWLPTFLTHKTGELKLPS